MAKKAENTDKIVKKAEKTDKKTFGIVHSGALNVRKDATRLAKVVKVLKDGEKVEILGEKDDFYKVPEGYAMKDYIKVEA